MSKHDSAQSQGSAPEQPTGYIPPLPNSGTPTAQQQWGANAQSGNSAYNPAPGYAAEATRCTTANTNAAHGNGKTKKQLIALTCALSLVCGILGGVIGDGLSNAAGSSSQPGGMQQNSMQQPGGQDGSSSDNTGGNAGAPGASTSNGGQSSQGGQANNGAAPSAPNANGSAAGSNDSSSDTSQNGSSASSGSASTTNASDSTNTQVI